MTGFIRYQSAAPNRDGRHPGVFALANGLAQSGRLTATDAEWLRTANARADVLYADPTTIVPTCYDPRLSPGARAWFRTSATHLVAMTRAYLELLDRYGVTWVELRTHDPGTIVYEDEVQVVALPRDAEGIRAHRAADLRRLPG